MLIKYSFDEVPVSLSLQVRELKKKRSRSKLSALNGNPMTTKNSIPTMYQGRETRFPRNNFVKHLKLEQMLG